MALPENKIKQIWNTAAAMLGLTRPLRRALRGEIGGLKVEVDGEDSQTRVKVHVYLKQLAASFSGPDSGDLDASVHVGDPQIDGRVELPGTRPAVLATLSPALRSELAQAIVLGGLHVTTRTVELTTRSWPASAGELTHLVRFVTGLARALQRAAERPEHAALVERATRDPLPAVRLEAMIALDACEKGDADALLTLAFADPLPAVRAGAALLLGGASLEAARADPSLEPALLALVTSGERMRRFALHALAELGTLATIAVLARSGFPSEEEATAITRLRERHPFAGEGQVSVTEPGREAGQVSLSAGPGALDLPMGAKAPKPPPSRD